METGIVKRIWSGLILLGLAIMAGQSHALGENWPVWRGPNGDGTSGETNVPTKWSGTDNIAWKTAIPGSGHSSPIVWGDRIFLSTAVPETKDRMLLCLNRLTGKIIWQKNVVNAPLEPKHADSSYASGTPATDGEKVYVSFLDGKDVVVAAYDFAGEQKWICRPGRFDSGLGYCVSPVVFEDTVLITACGNSTGVLAALSRSDGKKVWAIETKAHSMCFTVPLVRQMAGRLQMIVPGNKAISSYDPKDGKELWTMDGPSEQFAATPVFDVKTGLVFASSRYPKRIMEAIKPDGQGSITTSKDKVVWQANLGAPDVSSAIIAGDYFLALDKAALCCLETATGKLVWKQDKIGPAYASPVMANGLVYFLNNKGEMNVVKPGATFELVATNELGEKTFASPAISQGQIFLRGFNNLYCIGVPGK